MHETAVNERVVSRPFVAVTAATLFFFTYVGVLTPLIPRYIEDDLRGGELGVGLAIASFAGVAIASRPLIGNLIVRFGRRPVMLVGGAVAALSGAAYGLAGSLPVLLVLRGITGAGEAALFVAAMTVVADVSPSSRRAEAMSYFSVAVYGGLGLGPIIGEAMLSRSGFTAAFALGGGIAAIAGLVSTTVPRSVDTPTAGTPTIDSGAAITIELASERRSRFVHPDAVGPGVVLAAGMAAFVTFTAFVPDYSRSLGMSGSGPLFAVYSGVTLVLRVLGARVPERLGPRTTVSMAFGALGTAMLLLAAIREPAALWVAAAFVGVGMAFIYPSLMAFTVNRTPVPERPRAVSSFTMFFEAGTAFGGLALGSLAETFGKQSSFAAAVLLCLAGAWILRTVVIPGDPDPRMRPRSVDAPLLPSTCD